VKKSVFLTVLLGLFLASTAFALEPGDTLWTRTYGGSGTDYCYSVQQTSDGGYVATGYTSSFGAGGNDFYLAKTDANGDTLWTRTYGGTNTDYAYSVRQTSDGGYVVVGYTNSFGAGYEDAYLVKTDADGDTLWTRTYGWSTGNERANCVQQTSDGGYIIVGYTYSYETCHYDFYLVKTDANGDILWTRTYGGSGTEKAESVQQTSDGGYIVAGYTSSFGAGLVDAWLVKIDADGDFLWAQSYGGSNWDYAYSVQQTSDGGYILAGYEDSFGAGGKDVWSIKTDANGDTLWTRTYGGSGDDRSYSSQQTADGGYTIAGCTNSFGAGGFDVWLIKTDANGDTSWTRTYGGSASDRAEFVQQTTDGGYIVSGATSSFGAGGNDFWVLRMAGEAPPPDVSIEIVPDDPPVTVPQGSSFGYTGTVTNNTEDPQTTDIWVMAVGPTKDVYGPFKEFQEVPLDPSQSRSRHLTQRVANVAPLGFYNYIAYCGDYPSTVMDSSLFQIEVVEGVGSSQGGWVLTGSFLEGDLTDIPLEFALLSNYPNPFNASTLISYQLPTDGHVRLEVYNISGQKVATLVDGQQEAGYRSVTWDASEVSSGVYFYTLTAGDYTEIKTMTLLR
jgi:predicted secreted protein